MADRYFVESPITGDRAQLQGSEAHHLAHVMRARPGTDVVLFDGSGAEFAARVEQVGRSKVDLTIDSRSEVNRELPFELTLGVALPKGDRQKWLIEKAVEMGVSRLVPLDTRRSVAQASQGALGRLQRGVIEASKQCGRNRLMEVVEPRALAAFLEFGDAGTCRWFAHPGGLDAHAAQERFETCPRHVCLAVGPEGGFADEETALAVELGWQPVGLGTRILRIETAALVLASLAAVHFERLANSAER